MKSSINHNEWIKIIGEYIGMENTDDILRYCMAYTLQSLRAGEDMSRFHWGDTP